jgi:hypothetical protein
LYSLFRAQVDVSAAFNLRNPTFTVDAVVDNSFGAYVQPLVRTGLERFAERSADVVRGVSTTVAAVDAALAKTEATAVELRRVLETQRANAERAWRVAQDAAEEARQRAAATQRRRDAAYRLWDDTPLRQPGLRADRRNEWLRLAALYTTQTAAAAGLQVSAQALRRVLDALPPVDRNVMLLAADAAVAELRGRLRTAQQQLAALQEQIQLLLDTLKSGVDPLTIERAEFHASLDAVERGAAVSWKINGVFLGQPYSIGRTLNFAEPARAVADMVSGLIGG